MLSRYRLSKSVKFEGGGGGGGGSKTKSSKKLSCGTILTNVQEPVVQKQVNPGLTQNSKQIFQDIICKHENIFSPNIAWIDCGFPFSSFETKGYSEMHKLRQWAKS